MDVLTHPPLLQRFYFLFLLFLLPALEIPYSVRLEYSLDWGSGMEPAEWWPGASGCIPADLPGNIHSQYWKGGLCCLYKNSGWTDSTQILRAALFPPPCHSWGGLGQVTIAGWHSQRCSVLPAEGIAQQSCVLLPSHLQLIPDPDVTDNKVNKRCGLYVMLVGKWLNFNHVVVI